MHLISESRFFYLPNSYDNKVELIFIVAVGRVNYICTNQFIFLMLFLLLL